MSVKTTKEFHKSRLELILKTWFQLAKDETWFFTDAEDPDVNEKTSKQLLNDKFWQEALTTMTFPDSLDLLGPIISIKSKTHV